MNIVTYIGQQFARPSGIGGRISTLIMNLINRKMYNTCAEIITSDSYPGKVLDIGFGNGYMLDILNNRSPEKKLFGIDISSDALSMTRKRLGDSVSLSLSGVEKMPFGVNFFDTIYTINTFYFWKDPQKALSEIYQRMKHNGIFINICYTKKWLDDISYTKSGFNKLTNEDMLILHKRAGFSNSEIIEIQKGKIGRASCRERV